jgi:flagellar hook-associated protein 3 FlgL
MQTRIQDEKVELTKALSLEIDVDLAEAISNLTARQLAVEASLRTSASLLQLTILDFI